MLALSKLKAFADDNFIVAQMLQLFIDTVENIGEKEKMLVTNIFSYCNNVFKRLLSMGRQKSSLCGKGLIHD